MVKRKNVLGRRRTAGIIAGILGSCLFSGTAMAANLAAGVASDYSNSQLGVITGSRVTTQVDVQAQKGEQHEAEGQDELPSDVSVEHGHRFTRPLSGSAATSGRSRAPGPGRNRRRGLRP